MIQHDETCEQFAGLQDNLFFFYLIYIVFLNDLNIPSISSANLVSKHSHPLQPTQQPPPNKLKKGKRGVFECGSKT